MRLSHVALLRPGGNDTALVFDEIEPLDYRMVNDFIQSACPEVEQVMFVRKKDKAIPEGYMAGGEFCGNATRSLGYYLLNGKDGNIQLSISGSVRPLTVEVRNRCAKTQMPVFSSLDSVVSLSDTLSLVRLEGITHLILDPMSIESQQIQALDSLESQKACARKLLSDYKLDQEAAAGVMMLYINKGDVAMQPFVYVKSIDTFFAETACGSGSVAVGLLHAKRNGISISNLDIRQPSGSTITVDVDLNRNTFISAFIKGEVDIIYEGSI